MIKMTPSQYKARMRELENKQRQAINKYNQEVRQHNQARQQAFNKYNSEVKQYNSRLKQYQQKIRTELSRLQTHSTTIHYKVLYESSISLNQTHNSLENDEAIVSTSNYGNTFLDFSERENANSLEVLNVLEEANSAPEDLETLANKISETKILPILNQFSIDCADRWKGALFSLSPSNPDASRHFCTSSREIFTKIIESYAPDNAVLEWNPNCPKIENTKPTRKTKLQYLLAKKDINVQSALDFVDSSLDNIHQLFRDFNDATHGSAGKYTMKQLYAIKTRVEDGIEYLASICFS